MIKSDMNAKMIEYRQTALATVFLTAREDVQVIPADLGGGIDLIAEIVSKESRTCMFGVVIKGTSKPLVDERDASRFLIEWMRRSKTTQAFPFPILILVFSMREDAGYYAWSAEPEVSPEGIPKLLIREAPLCRRATRRSLDGIVEDVNRWHQSLYSLLIDESR
jgi:hypothetical protein